MSDRTPRIGQLLSQAVPLSDHDLEEILQEQKVTRQRFGDAALALGMVQPQHVWDAWMQQLHITETTIDLAAMGVDSQALNALPGRVAAQFRVVPVRVNGHELVVACGQPLDETAKRTVQQHCKQNVLFAFAKPEHVDAAIARYYASNSSKNEAA